MSAENATPPSLTRRTAAWLQALLAGLLGERFDRSPLADAEALARFCRTRAAYVAQTALYGYLRTRMGTEYRRHFEDEAFSASIRIATAKLYASCLSDLTVFAVATAARSDDAQDPLSADECAALAHRIYVAAWSAGIADVAIDEAPDAAGMLAAFDARVAAIAGDWAGLSEGEAAFVGSAADLVRYAPVIDDFKRSDREIVRNSIRFRWRDVREQARKRIDGAALADAWRRRTG